MTPLVLAVTVAMAALLLWAGLEKARDVPAFAAVFRELGLPEGGVRAAATLAIALELGVALALIFRPGSGATPAAVIGLAACFALAGFIALRRHKDIHCGCLGPYGNGRLGRNQLAAFPLWLGGAGLLWLNGPARTADIGGPPLFAAVALTMALLRSFGVVQAAREARGDRRSAQEMYRWLSR